MKKVNDDKFVLHYYCLPNVDKKFNCDFYVNEMGETTEGQLDCIYRKDVYKSKNIPKVCLNKKAKIRFLQTRIEELLYLND